MAATLVWACTEEQSTPNTWHTDVDIDDTPAVEDVFGNVDVFDLDVTPGPSTDVEDVGGDAVEDTRGDIDSELDAEAPDSVLPDAEEPDTGVPDAEEPDTSVPDAEEPDASVPDAEEPDTSLPDVEEPDTTVPDVEEPDTTVTDVEEPDTTVTDVEEPDTTVTDVEVPECVVTADCQGELPTCTVWECQAGDCVTAFATPGAPCNDGDACTSGDGCQALGICAGGLVSCDDGDACTTDSCESGLGCVHAAVDCEDGDACTSNACVKSTGCVFMPDVCDDGNACTTDVCTEGACANTALFVCSDPVRFRGFTGRSSELSLVGAAALSGDALRLTPAIGNQSGSAWLTSKLALRYGFSARFVFDMSVSSGTGADGIAFVVQSVSATASGSEAGIGAGLTVWFDSYQNSGEASAKRILVRAATQTLATVSLTGDWTNSGSHAVVVTYVPGRLDVVVDGVTQVDGLAVDLGTVTNALDADGKAWVGFTSRTGGTFENHDVKALFVGPVCPAGSCGDGNACTTDACDLSLGCTSTTTCEVDTTANVAPTLSVPVVTLTGAGGPATCSATATDLDQDFITLTYAWEATGVVNGVVGTGATLDSLPLLVGDGVVCTVTASDGQVSTTASASATVENAAPFSFADGPQISSSADAEDRAPHAKDTLYCELTGTYDTDGDDIAVAYAWSVDGTVVLEETRTSGVSTLTGVYAKGDLVRCQATPTDGVTAGSALEASLTVGNHAPTCSAQRGDASYYGPDDSVSCWCEDQPLQDVDGDATETCVWTGLTMGAVISGPCTLTGAQTPDGDLLSCTITSSDGSASGSATTSLRVGGGNIGNVTWATPGVTLSATALTTSGLDDPLTCKFNRTATDSSGGTVSYFIMWRVDNNYGVIYGNEAQVGTTTLRELDAITPGRAVSCLVWAFVVDWDFDRQPQAESNSLTVVAGDAVFNTVSSSHQTSVAMGETFVCTALIHSGTDGDPISVAVQSSSDGLTWATVASATTTATTAVASFNVTEGAGPWLRCLASVTDAGTLVEAGTSDAVRAAATPLELGDVLITPVVGDACAPRELVLGLLDPDAASAETPLRIDVVWLVDGIAAGTDSLDLTGLDVGWNAVTLPMLGAGAADRQSVIANVTLQKGTLAAVTTQSAAALVYNDAAEPSSVSLPSTARIGDTVTCKASGIPTSYCGDDAHVAYAWTADGVLLDETSATIDTSALVGGQALRCAARVGGSTGYGSAVMSDSCLLQPGSWVIEGEDADDYAGHAVTVLGDLDGDEYPELAIGAPNATAFERTNAGKVYVIDGGPMGGTTYLSDVDAGDYPGAVLYGDTGSWPPYSSICRTKSPSIQVSCSPGNAGFNTQGDSEGPLGDGLGTRIVSPGDVDGDGVADLIVSAPYAFAHGQYLAGRVYVISGAVLAETDAALVGSTVVGDLGMTFEGEQGVWQSKLWSMSGAHHEWDGHNAGFGLATGDFDGDGISDVAIGSPLADPAGSQVNGGRTYVVPLGTGTGGGWLGTMTDATDLTGTGDDARLPGRVLSGKTEVSFLWGQVGAILSGVPDRDGDGRDELFVGDIGWWSQNFVVPGVDATDQDAVDLTSSDKVLGIDSGAFSFSSFGIYFHPFQVTSGRMELFSYGSNVGDVNGDGLGDVAVPYVEKEGDVSQVEIAVYFGGTETLVADDLDAGVGGFVVEGRPSGDDGTDVAMPLVTHAVGDVNGDGLDDVAVTITRSSSITVLEPRLYVIYGKADGSTLTLTDIEAGIGGFVMEDLPSRAYSVAGGDLDGDGLNDLIIGMPNASGSASSSGRIMVRYSRGESLTQLGLPTADALTGSTGADRIALGRGDDSVTGGGGADVLYGGAGSDVITISDASFVRLDGGLGSDRLVLDGVSLDLKSVRGRVTGFETIDLGANGTLSLTATDLFRISTTSNTLIVEGEAGSRLNVLDYGFTFGGDAEVDGVPALTLVSGHATLLVVGEVDLRVAPGLTSLAFSVAEDAADSAFGILTAEDIDGDAVTFSVDLSEITGLSFDGTSLVAAPGLDHETAGTLLVPVTVTDIDGLSTTATVVVTVEDAPEAPAFSAPEQTASISENPVIGRMLATVRATDPDDGDELVYAWVSETHFNTTGATYTNRQAFGVDATSGRVTVVDGSYLDYETADVVELVISVTDNTGLTDSVLVTVTLLDYETLPQTFTLPFLAENRGLWDSDGSLDGDALAAPLSTIDLTSTLDEGDTAIQSPVSDDSYPFSGSVSGAFGGSFEVSFSDGYLSAYLPVDITITLPDDVKLGAAFTIASDWTLNEDAVVWGETPGFSLVFTLFYEAVSALLDNPLFDSPVSEFMGDIEFELGFTIEPQKFGGAPFDEVYPDGADLYSPASTDGGTSYWSWDGAFDLDPAQLEGEGLTENLILGALLLPPGTKQEDYQNPDLVMSTAVSEKFLESQLTLAEVATMAGVPYSSFGVWQGDLTMPLLGGSGYATLKYDMWSSRFGTSARYSNLFAVEAEAVMGTLTFEDGTTFTRSLREGFQNITLPAGADVNGDGRVTFTLDIAIDAHMYKFWDYNISFDYLSKMLSAEVKIFMKELDWTTGEYSGDAKLYDSGSFGPIDTSTYSVELVHDSGTPNWPLLGFETITVTGGIQLTK